jgi:hypothetical protein
MFLSTGYGDTCFCAKKSVNGYKVKNAGQDTVVGHTKHALRRRVPEKEEPDFAVLPR